MIRNLCKSVSLHKIGKDVYFDQEVADKDKDKKDLMHAAG